MRNYNVVVANFHTLRRNAMHLRGEKLIYLNAKKMKGDQSLIK